MGAVQDAIIRAAQEEGEDPATALAYAQRESGFNPYAHNSKTIYGLYQMSGPLRAQYGIGNSSDPYTQTKGFLRFLNDNKATMARQLGRPVSDSEAYTGHFFGAGRAARMMGMDPNTPVGHLFNGQELAENPNIRRAGTVGQLLSTTVDDMDRRLSNFGAESKPLDFSSFDQVADATPPSQSTATPQLDLGQFEPVS